MIFPQILFFAASLPLVASSRHGRKGHRGMETCEFYDPVPGQKAYDTNRKLSEQEFQFDKRATRSVDITVNLHAAVPGNASCDLVSRDQIYKQYEVLRDEYKPYGFNMILGEITRTRDSKLTKLEIEFDDEDRLGGSTPEIEAFWKKRRTGDYKTLNIFIYQQMTDSLGVCNFPDEDREEDTYYLDACHIVADTMPGSGTGGVWNSGGSAVHEVGHWFGLLHVWTESCDDEGDLIDDTPQQKAPSVGCEEIADTCPDKPGKSNAHNFMDYSGDECQSEFTPGQQKRMHQAYHGIRAKKSGQ